MTAYRANMDNNVIVSLDLGGRDRSFCTIVERRGAVLHVLAQISDEEFEDSYLDANMLIRFKLIELRMLEKALQAKESVVREIKAMFACLIDGHDFFSVNDSEGDGPYVQHFTYLECRNCGEQHPYDGRDDYMDSEDDWDRTPL